MSRLTGWTTRTCLTHVLDRLDELVLKPVDGAGGKGIVIGPQADERRSTTCAVTVAADPRGLDRAATGGTVHLTDPDRGQARARATSTCGRSRSTTATDVWVLPGGLTRVALPEGDAGRELQPGRWVQGHLGTGP